MLKASMLPRQRLKHRKEKRNLLVNNIAMDPTFWSEYKVTFCEPVECILNYILCKGYVHNTFNINYFKYNHFNNHFSINMDTTLFGIKEISTECHEIKYISETTFNRINNELKDLSYSDIDNALSSNKEKIIIKRGIFVTKSNCNLIITISDNTGVISQNTFGKYKNSMGYLFCKLELVKIKNNDTEGFIPFNEIELKKEVNKIDELSAIIDTLKIEHNNQLLEISNLCEVRVLSLIDKIKELEHKIDKLQLNSLD